MDTFPLLPRIAFRHKAANQGRVEINRILPRFKERIFLGTPVRFHNAVV